MDRMSSIILVAGLGCFAFAFVLSGIYPWAITDAKVEDFFNKMVEAGVIEADIDWKSAYDTSYVGNGLGMDLK